MERGGTARSQEFRKGPKPMETAIAIQLFIAVFCAFLAARKRRRPLVWGLVGMVPVLGVVAALLVPRAAPARHAGKGSPRQRSMPPRPKRCCGHYIPDCRGCPYFRRALFQSDRQKEDGRVGHCEFFDRDLYEQDADTGVEIVFDE
jgi:hypothetical protein